MATTFKTPGVYVQEIDSFPPSINAVETAIPAFIGYTQLDQSGTLSRKPQKVSSLLEYEQYFGVGPDPEVEKVNLDANNNFQSAEVKIKYKMYESVKLFYANGGGDCYIVSAGTFPVSSPSVNDFLEDTTSLLSPMSAIAKEDEPTLLVFPDNDLLGTSYFEVYTAALEQCATLQNRFLVCDVDVDPADQSHNPGAGFRDDIGINHLSYGAAYAPWINIASTKPVSYEDFRTKVYKGTTQVSSLANLTTDTATFNSVQDLDNMLADIATIESATSTLESGASSLSSYYSSLKAALPSASSPAVGLKSIFTFAYDIAAKLNSFVTGSTALHAPQSGNANTSLLSSVQNLIGTGGSGQHFSDLYSILVPYTNLASDTHTESRASIDLTVTRGTTISAAYIDLTVTAGTPVSAGAALVDIGTPGTGDKITELSVTHGSSTTQLFDNSTPYSFGSGSYPSEMAALAGVINAYQGQFTAAVVSTGISLTDATGAGAGSTAFTVTATPDASVTTLTLATHSFAGGRDADKLNTLTVHTTGSTNIALLGSGGYTWGTTGLSGELTSLVGAINLFQSSFIASVIGSGTGIRITDATGAGAGGNSYSLNYGISTTPTPTLAFDKATGTNLASGTNYGSIDSLGVNTGSTVVPLIATAFVQNSTDTSDSAMATRLAAAITAGGSSFSVSNVSGNTITVLAPSGSGAAANTYVVNSSLSSMVGLTTNYTHFVGGVGAVGIGISAYTSPSAPSGLASQWGGGSNPFASTALPGTYYSSGLTDAQKAAYIASAIDSTVNDIIQLYGTILPMAVAKEANAEAALVTNFPVMASIVNGINNTPISLPPSGAVVGLYASVDNDRGVWKAPANVSINNVLGPDAIFNNGELDGLNVDVNAGKSINAIRPFKGKGTLVYGARTLAGNDNNWRYVNVRRFFIMVEQSVKKAIESFVFEPNDANTWNRTKAMVDAFLFQQWRAGALQGSKPDQAYFVKVGLGETMVAQDILEGRMIVSIGMAVVHPAEFIVLQFSQIMPQS